MKEEAFLREIRTLDGLSRATLRSITVDKRRERAVFHLITDKTYTPQEEAAAQAVCARYVPLGFSAEVHIRKFVPDEESVRQEILREVARLSPAFSAFVSEEDVQVECGVGSCRFCLEMDERETRFLPVAEILDKVSGALSAKMCGAFVGVVRKKEKPLTVEKQEGEWEEEVDLFPPRYFAVEGYRAIDGGDKPTLAKYIEDCKQEEEELTVCGKIVHIEERQTNKGKPMFRLSVSDGTGRLYITYFSKQSTVEKVRALREGDSIVCFGNNEVYNERLSYHAKRINFGAPPENFVPQSRPFRAAPKSYRTVFPQPYEDFNEISMFSKTDIPSAVRDNEFVVFDLETTGLNNTGTGGTFDSIIEIGAVRIRNGEICERFSTFLSYDRKLAENIVGLTGITDEMLLGAPSWEQVIPDFYKFCEGCYLVGHNTTFDYRFVEHYAEQLRYTFTQKRFDTMTLAQEMLTLSNYKLNTIADFYGISFRHHRAFDDALTTAKIFIELMRKRKELPV